MRPRRRGSVGETRIVVRVDGVVKQEYRVWTNVDEERMGTFRHAGFGEDVHLGKEARCARHPVMHEHADVLSVQGKGEIHVRRR